MIMIGPGTGVTPFIAFLRERAKQSNVADSWLFYGCRDVSKDFLYRQEIDSLCSGGVLTKCNVAVSRQIMAPSQPLTNMTIGDGKYVQDSLRANGKQVIEWMTTANMQCNIYVCGDAAGMARQV